jgi:pimeloyl-ACP methyl ester carboxylesterase
MSARFVLPEVTMRQAFVGRNVIARVAGVVLTTLLFAAGVPAQEDVSFRAEDGGHVHADMYGEGSRGVVLVHGGRFDKGSWGDQARALVAAGFRVLALDLRGYGQSQGPGQADTYTAPFHHDILAAVRFLRRTEATSVSVVGASLGGAATAEAVHAAPGEIDRIVLLAALPDTPPGQLRVRTLFIVAEDDRDGRGPRLPRIRAYYEEAAGPKDLLIVEGSAHAQFLFRTDQGERVMREIVRFLSAP